MLRLVSLLLVLLLAAAPVAATCGHGSADAAHGEMDMSGDAGEAPCHGGPAAPPDDPATPPCASVCCAAEAPVTTPDALVPVAAVADLPAPVVADAPPRPVFAEARAAESPPPLGRRHLALQRFLI